MSDPSPPLDRAGIEDAFRRLGDRLARRGSGDLDVFGGAAMALHTTRAGPPGTSMPFKPHGIVLRKHWR